MAYVCVASNEELVAGTIAKASSAAPGVNTSAIRWGIYTVPEGHYGGSIWGSTGAVNLKRNQLYMAVANNFWALHHASYRSCASVATFDDRRFARRAKKLGLTSPIVVLP